jgi:hypothetical protein
MYALLLGMTTRTVSAPALTPDDVHRFALQVEAMPAGSAAEAIDWLRQFEMLLGTVSAAQMRHAMALEDERRADDAARGVPVERRGAGAPGEIGLARRVSPNWSTRWLRAARELREQLPATFAQLARGATTERRALTVVRETRYLSRELRARVDAELAPQLEGWGDRRIEGEARKLAQQLDASGAAARASRAAKDRRATVRPAPDVMAYLTLLMPVREAVACYGALYKHATTLITRGTPGVNEDGSPRTRDQIMVDTAFERLTGRCVATGVDIEIGLVMSDETLFRGGDEPAFIPGHGPVPAPLARDWALARTTGRCSCDTTRVGEDERAATDVATGMRSEVATDKDSDLGDGIARVAAKRWLRRFYRTPDRRQLAAMDSRRREFGENQARFIRVRDQGTCRTPWCDARIHEIDHIEDHARGGPTAVTNGQGYCVACNRTKQAAGWRTIRRRDGTVTTITPTGHRYASKAPAPPGTDRRTVVPYLGAPVQIVLSRHEVA